MWMRHDKQTWAVGVNRRSVTVRDAMNRDRNQHLLWASLLGTIAVAFALRVLLLDYQELRGDEAFGYFFSLRPLTGIVSATLALQEPHPVASYFIQHGWLAWAGHSEFALRFLSVCGGVLAVPLLYRLGRRLDLSMGSSLLAAGLLAISPYAIWHSQDARMYSISLALTIASTWLALEALARRRWPAWGAYLLVTWLALHTHYFSIFIVLAQNLFVFSRVLFVKQERQQLLPWLLAQGLLAAAYAPWLLAARSVLANYAGTGDSPGLWQMLVRSQSAFAVGETMPAAQRPVLAGLAALLLLFGIGSLAAAPRPNESSPGPYSRRWVLWFLLLYLTVPLVATWVSAQSRPIFSERYLIAAVPPFFLLAASGLVDGYRLLQRIPRLAAGARSIWAVVAPVVLLLWLVVVVVSLQNYFFDPAYSKSRGWRELAAAMDRLAAGLAPDAVHLVENFPDPALWYYYRGPVAHSVLPPRPNDRTGANQEVANLVANGVERVILAEQPAAWWDATGIASEALAGLYSQSSETQVGRWPVRVYSRPDVASMVPVDVRFTNGAGLVGYAIEPATAAEGTVPGGLVVVHLDWQGAMDDFGPDTKLFLHLVDAAGRPLAQTDQFVTSIPNRGGVTSHGILLPATLAPGTYRLLGGLYDAGLTGAPRVLTTDGEDAIELGSVIVRAPLP